MFPFWRMSRIRTKKQKVFSTYYVSTFSFSTICQLFKHNCFFKGFLYSHFVFVIFFEGKLAKKSACKMMVKLTPHGFHTFFQYVRPENNASGIGGWLYEIFLPRTQHGNVIGKAYRPRYFLSFDNFLGNNNSNNNNLQLSKYLSLLLKHYSFWKFNIVFFCH